MSSFSFQLPLTFCTISGKVFLHQFNNDTGKQKYCDQVWNCHESVKGFRNAPHQTQIHRGSYDGNQRIHQHKWLVDTGTEQELDAACPV